MESAILKITCNDKEGIIAGITNFIFKNNGNIISLSEFVEPTTKDFFMRVKWDLTKFKITKGDMPQAVDKLAKGLKICGNWELFFSEIKPKMAIMVSKYDHCLWDLLLRHKSGELGCEIPVIISNHKDLQYVAEQFGIDFYHIPVTKTNKKESEKEQAEILNDYNVDFIVMARYMQILSKAFIKKYENNIINIHHSFLPAFKGARPYHQAYDRGVKIIGATAHFASQELDQGPIISQEVVNVFHYEKPEDLVQKGRDIERRVLATAVKLHIDNRIFVCKNKTIIL